MSKHPRHYAPAFKAQLVQELLREEKTISQLATEYSIHPNQLGRWKATVVDGMPSLFERRDRTEALLQAHQREVEDLYAQIGRLTTQLAWVKRKTGLDPAQR
jgi:putative transposase